MRGFRTFVRGALPSLKERACARARVGTREAQYTYLVTPQEVIEALGAGQIAKYSVVRVLEGPAREDEYSVLFRDGVSQEDRDWIVKSLRNAGLNVR